MYDIYYLYKNKYNITLDLPLIMSALYYGDEAGVCGFTDPDNRRTYPWGNEDKSLLEFHKKMIENRRQLRYNYCVRLILFRPIRPGK